MTKKQNKRIIGIDPGFGRVGWGIIEGSRSDWTHIAHGCIDTNSKKPFLERLESIYDELQKIIDTYKPQTSAVEELFFYKNVTTAMKVGQARGVILLTLRQAGLPVYEYTPLEIKQTTTGYGRADKQQMQRMIQMQLHLKNIPKPDDAADGLATALTCGLIIR